MKLEVGYNYSFEVRKERITVPAGVGFTILYISDLHFTGYSSNTVKRLIQNIAELDPDIILLGGDYADTRQGIQLFAVLLSSIPIHKHIVAIPGNHDHFWGIEKVKEVAATRNVIWLENSSVDINIGNIVVRIDGGMPTLEKTKAGFSILLVHKPADFSQFKDKYNLILAGHLHGCQMVLWQTKKGLYPGRLFYKWNILKTQPGNCVYLISKGIGDTLPIRYNCKKDIIFVSASP